MPANEFRLPRHVVPSHYDIRLELNLDDLDFEGSVGIDIGVSERVDTIVLNTAEIDIKTATSATPTWPRR